MAFWIFKYNPEKYRLSERLADPEPTITWTIRRFRDEIGPGDTVFLWETGDNRGIRAVLHVDEGPREMAELENEQKYWVEPDLEVCPRVLATITHRDVNLPSAKLRGIPGLEGLSVFHGFQQATNFSVTDQEGEILLGLVETEESETPNQRNPPWQRDELILALDLYFRHPPGSISKVHPEIIALSDLLNALPIHAHRPDEVRFRNPNGVYMKLCNFLRLDPDYHGKGLSRGARLEQEVWEAFATNRELLAQLADAIRRGQPLPETQQQLEDDEEVFPEGRVLYRLHRARERNRDLVKRAKERAMRQHGRLACVACGFDFAERYGPLGAGFIECHHTRPLSELLGEQPTRIEDVALVCSNCHRMVHRKRPWLGIEELASLLGEMKGTDFRLP